KPASGIAFTWLMVMRKFQTFLVLLLLVSANSARAQSPTGTVAGIVTDPAGAALAGARISITNRASGLNRGITTSGEGHYSAAALPPGEYRVAAEASGFDAIERTATVEAGTTTKLDIRLQVGAVSEEISVNTGATLIHYDHPQVSGLINANQIENLPLNGRNFLDLAKMEPGVTNA